MQTATMTRATAALLMSLATLPALATAQPAATDAKGEPAAAVSPFAPAQVMSPFAPAAPAATTTPATTAASTPQSDPWAQQSWGQQSNTGWNGTSSTQSSVWTTNPNGLDRGRGPSFAFQLRIGSTVGWFAGGHVGLGVAVRLADSTYLDLGLYGGGGVGLGDSDGAFATGGGDASIRIMHWGRMGWTARFGAGVGYLGEFEYGDGVDYEYITPHALVGGGVIFAQSSRMAWGVEGTLRAGYASMTANYWWDEDYSGFFGGLDVSLVLFL